MSARRGALIVLEGVDRAGKTTQCAKLVEFLHSLGRPAELWRFPDRTTTIGKMIDSYLLNATELDDGCVHLLFSANRWEKRDLMMKKLKQGVSLVVDRYAFSGVAFTSAKGIPELNKIWCMAPDAGLVSPDVVYFLDLSTDESAARRGFGEEIYERPVFQQAVAKEFRSMASFPYWRTVDASRSMDEVHDLIKEDVKAVLERVDTSLRVLWEGMK